jgi:multiple sugar transport system permease protein
MKGGGITTNYFHRKRKMENLAGYLFLLPAMIAFLIFLAIPLGMAFGLVFMDYNLISPPKFSGMNNIIRASLDPLFTRSLSNTARFFMFITPIHCVLALGLAYVVFQVRNARLRSIYRGLIFFPTIVTTASVAIVWVFMFGTEMGFINYFIRRLGGANVPWMTDTLMIYVTIAIFSAWKFIGTTFLYYFIGLQNIPSSYHEAAMIDGAGRFQTFFRVTLPLLTPTVFFVFITNMIGVFQIFEEPYFIAGGNTNARSLALHIYETAFNNIRFGYASLLSVVMFFIIMTITVLQFLGQRKWVNYDYE